MEVYTHLKQPGNLRCKWDNCHLLSTLYNCCLCRLHTSECQHSSKCQLGRHMSSLVPCWMINGILHIQSLSSISRSYQCNQRTLCRYHLPYRCQFLLQFTHTQHIESIRTCVPVRISHMLLNSCTSSSFRHTACMNCPIRLLQGIDFAGMRIPCQTRVAADHSIRGRSLCYRICYTQGTSIAYRNCLLSRNIAHLCREETDMSFVHHSAGRSGNQGSCLQSHMNHNQVWCKPHTLSRR